MKQKQKFSIKSIILIFIITLIIVSYLLIKFYYNLISNENFEHEITKFAQLGDFLGGTLNPLIAFFTVILLIFTIYIQTKELEATREELEKSRIAQQEQSKSLLLQNIATKQQMFENTFFKLSEQFFQSKNDLKRGKDKSIKAIDSMLIWFKHHQLPYYQANSNDTQKSIQTIYDEYNKDIENITGIYFGQIYQILKFIHESNISDKQRYINIFRAQFTKDELEFLFYHCLGSIGKRKFKSLIEQYEFFEHISINEDITPLIKEYKANAFGKNEEILTLYKSL